MGENSDNEKRTLTDAEIEQRRDAGRRSGEARRGKELTEKELQQRRDAAQLSTGPKTDEGKAASSRNNWKHGLYSAITRAPEWQRLGLSMIGRPCKSTCSQYPCSLVDEGVTQPGMDCMDKQIYVEAFDSIMATMNSGDPQYAHAMLASQVAQALEVLSQLRKEISENGVVIINPYTTKDGKLIKDGDRIVGKAVSNPALPHFAKLLDVLGVSLPELMVTPRAILSAKDDDDDSDSLDDLMSSLGEKFGRGLRRGVSGGQVYDGEVVDE